LLLVSWTVSEGSKKTFTITNWSRLQKSEFSLKMSTVSAHSVNESFSNQISFLKVFLFLHFSRVFANKINFKNLSKPVPCNSFLRV